MTSGAKLSIGLAGCYQAGHGPTAAFLGWPVYGRPLRHAMLTCRLGLPASHKHPVADVILNYAHMTGQ